MSSEEIIDSGFATSVSIRSNKQRGKNLLIALWVSLGTEVLVLISLLLMYFTIDRGFTGYDNHFELFEKYTFLRGILSLFSFVVSIIVIVFWILWMRRAYYNLHALQAPNLAYDEGMAAGGWFIPVLNLWLPAQIMSNIWKQTQLLVVENKRLIENSAIVGVWWTLFLLDRLSAVALNIISRYAVYSEQRLSTMNDVYGFLRGEVLIQLVITLFFSIPLTFAAISMVKKSNRMQNLLYKKENGEEITNTMIIGK